MSYGPNFLMGGTASASAGGGTPAFAFDGNWGSEWEQGGGYPHYLQYDLGSGITKTPTKLSLRGGLWGPGENPKTFTLAGSNTGVFGGEETVLLTVADAGWTVAYQLKEWTFANTTAFRYFRLNMTASTSGTSWCEIVEMCLFGADSYGDNICTGGTASASSELSGHESSRAFDGDDGTDWYSNNATSWWIQYELATAKVVAELVLTSYNSSANFPKDFTLKASNTGAFGGEEVTLLTVTGAAYLQDHQQQAWPVTNSTAYKYYRVAITAIQSGAYAQLAAITMHESLAPPPTSLVIQDLTLAPSIDGNLTLAAKSTLVIQDLTLAPSLDNLSMGSKATLTIQDLTLAPSIDNLALTAHAGGAANMFLVF